MIECKPNIGRCCSTNKLFEQTNPHAPTQYIVERHGNTLLPQYLGMYRLTVDGVQYYFVVMRNVFSSHLSIHR